MLRKLLKVFGGKTLLFDETFEFPQNLIHSTEKAHVIYNT